jgi:hypothetical protein
MPSASTSGNNIDESNVQGSITALARIGTGDILTVLKRVDA